jgi:ribonuclease BN (tRNA processing enzyme)
MSIDLWKLIASKKIKLKNTPWTIIGYSRAARNTTLYIQELGVLLDAGMMSEVSPTHIFISHAHLDHAGELSRYLIDSSNSNITTTVVLPKPSSQFVKNQVISTIRMTKHNPTANPKWNVIEASIPTNHEKILSSEAILNTSGFLPEIEIIKKMRFKIELFKCTHTIATTGYGFIEIRSKLKPKYVGLSQEELDIVKSKLKNEYTKLSSDELDIIKLKLSQDFTKLTKDLDIIESKIKKDVIDVETKNALKHDYSQMIQDINQILKPEYIGYSRKKLNIIKSAGFDIYINIYEDICEDIEVPHFCYLGDTDHKLLYDDKSCKIFNKNIEKYQNILVECTFLYDEEEKKAKEKCHMLWKNLKLYIDSHPDNNFILYHFSMMYKAKEIINFFDALKLVNVTPLIHDFDSLFLEKLDNLLKDISPQSDEIFKTYLRTKITEMLLSTSNPCGLHKDINIADDGHADSCELHKDINIADDGHADSCELHKDINIADDGHADSCELYKDINIIENITDDE